MTKNRLITILLMALLCTSLVFAADSFVPGNFAVGQSTASTRLEVNGTVTATQLSGVLTWTDLSSYPAACSADTYVSTVGDTLSCTAISDVYLSNTGDTATGAYIFTGGTFDTDTLNTGQGDNELYAMNQDLESTDRPDFAGLDVLYVGTGNAIDVDVNANGKILYGNSEGTTSDAFRLDLPSITTGRGIYAYVNSAGHTGDGGIIRVVSDNPSATGTLLSLDNDGTGSNVFLNQDGNGIALSIDSEATTSTVVQIDNAGTGDSINIDSGEFVVDDEGKVGIGISSPTSNLHVYRNLGSASTSTPVSEIENANSGDDQNTLTIKNLGTGSGLTIESVGATINQIRQFTVGEAVVEDDVVYFKSDGKMWETDADAEATSIGTLGIVTETCSADTVCKILIGGSKVTTGLTTGSLYYLSTTKAGWTTTAPSATGDVVRPIGQAFSTTELHFNPDYAWAVN